MSKEKRTYDVFNSALPDVIISSKRCRSDNLNAEDVKNTAELQVADKISTQRTEKLLDIIKKATEIANRNIEKKVSDMVKSIEQMAAIRIVNHIESHSESKQLVFSMPFYECNETIIKLINEKIKSSEFFKDVNIKAFRPYAFETGLNISISLN
jgi:hypothetical protein